MFTVENQSLVVKYDVVEGEFSVVEKNSGAVFMKSGKLGLTNASAKVQAGRDDVFGRGSGIELTQTIVYLDLRAC